MTMALRAAARAYQQSSDTRGLRMQEADVFYRVIGGLRAGQSGSATERARALADMRQVWLMLDGLLRDPANALPEELRANILSIGKTVLRVSEQPSPDFDFLIAVNENMAAGLAAGM